MRDRTELLRQLMKSVGISSFQMLGDRVGMSRRAINTLRKGAAANLKYTDLAKLSEILQIELSELIAKFIDVSDHNQSLSSQIADLRQEYQELQRKLENQQQESRSLFVRETIQQLESLLLQLPSAVYAAQQNPQMLAKSILPLLRPIDTILQKWGIIAIGSVGAKVIYDPQKHQLMEVMAEGETLKEGDLVTVRYVGYLQGEKLLHRARVCFSKTD
jgi:molecular chaperone GrpE (heat shock protein)